MSAFEDLSPGSRLAIGSHHFSAENIRSFAQRFDPQPCHLDEAAAARSPFGALRASDWHVAVAWMPLLVAYRAQLVARARARGDAEPLFGPSPGVADLKWFGPVLAGDTVIYTSEVTGLRRSARRPGWSLLTLHTVGVNQRGETVISFINTIFASDRGATA